MWTVVVLRGMELPPAIQSFRDKKGAIRCAYNLSDLHNRATYDVNFECRLVVINTDDLYKNKV